MTKQKFIRRTIVLGFLPTLTACALPKFLSFKGTKLKWQEIVLSASNSANQNSPILTDLVMVMDEVVLEKLLEMPPSKWFATRSDLLKTFPQTFTYRTWEIVPGQLIRIPGSSFGSPRVVGVLAYADYLAPGPYRLRVEQLQGLLTIHYETNGFSASATE